jgi:hypothetical protein
MRRLLALSAKLYPRAWRERYGAEFDALMEDVEPDWQELANILGGAVKMQMKSSTAYLKLAAAMAVLGALAALGVSFRLPDRYVSSAVLKMTPAKDEVDNQAAGRLTNMQQDVLSRNSLAELIQRPSLNLYPGERQRIPMEDVVEQMRRDIQIRPAPGPDGASRTFSISFTYPDLVKAQEVTLELTQKLILINLTVNRNRASIWRTAWNEDPPPGERLEVIANASDPRKAGGPNRVVFVAVGLLVGILIASVLRWPKPALRLAGFGLAGCALAAAVSYLIPNRYISTAVMRVTPAMDPKRWYAGRQAESPTEHVRRMEHDLLSDASLEQIIRTRRLNLYENERAKVPMEEVVRRMRDRDIRIQMLGTSNFLISFSYVDPEKAQRVVRELVTGFTERNIIEERARVTTAGPEYQMMAEHKIGENLEVLDPASLPQAPASPNRWAIAAMGLAAGLLLGTVTLLRRPQRSAMQAAVVT